MERQRECRENAMMREERRECSPLPVLLPPVHLSVVVFQVEHNRFDRGNKVPTQHS